MTKIYKIRELPEGTLITKNMPSIDYYDSYKILTNNDDSISKITEKILALPGWMNMALLIRYLLVVKPFGLKTGRFDDMAKSSEVVPVVEKNENEIVMGQDDKHLYYRISFMKKKLEQGAEIYLNTVVKFNNIWGKIYFLPVKPGHKIVVKCLLKRLTY